MNTLYPFLPAEGPNRLIHENSPYLRQHAHNLVDWHPWGPEALWKAITHDKPIILSIGYSACHWCHVMEKESFCNKAVALHMNRNFINIKVDKEERPDIDQLYMDALQAMGVKGGWPLNVFLTPMLKPFYGGTYFEIIRWLNIVRSVARAFAEHRDEMELTAGVFAANLKLSIREQLEISPSGEHFTDQYLRQMAGTLAGEFDHTWGGIKMAPKFPTPVLWHFMLDHATEQQDAPLLKHVHFTLTKMAHGGIYDHAGGGFCRYSVDNEWFEPHFEKMLYDNAQLLSLYARAWTATGEPLFRQVAYDTAGWLLREMQSKEGPFYTSLDADSEHEEGLFYTWSWLEFSEHASHAPGFLTGYFNVTEEGNWKNGRNILFVTRPANELTALHSLTTLEAQNAIARLLANLLEARGRRIRPARDTKLLTGWNSLVIKGLAEAAIALADKQLLTPAIKCADWIEGNVWSGGVLYRTYRNNHPWIYGMIEDYAATISGLIALYNATFDAHRLHFAYTLTARVIDEFYDPEEGLFYYTSSLSEALIARQKEVFDSVMPSGNATMAHSLYLLGHYFENDRYITLATDMMALLKDYLKANVHYMAQWASLAAMLTKPTATIAIAGPQATAFAEELHAAPFTNKIVATGNYAENKIPMLQGKVPIDGRTTLHVCYHKTCHQPVYSVEEALTQLK